MADVKWIKFATGFPNSKKLKYIRKFPDGNTIALFWVFLICLAGDINEDGMIFLTKEVPYTEEMLADEFDIDINTIRLGLTTFRRLGMIEIVDNIICLSSWEKWQSTDRLSELREYNRLAKQRSRAKQKALMESNVCQYCGGVATGYDHIVAKYNGGGDDDANKVPCCKSCNSSKRDKNVVDFLNMNLDTIDLNVVCKNEKLSKFVRFNGSFFEDVIDSQEKCQSCQDTDIEEDKDIDIDKEIYKSVVSYLNQKAGTNYKASTKKTQTTIHARLAEGFDLDDFKTVIDKKCAEWLGDEKMERYLRPETLFGTKFEGYLNARVTKVNTGVPADVEDPLDGLFG